MTEDEAKGRVGDVGKALGHMAAAPEPVDWERVELLAVDLAGEARLQRSRVAMLPDADDPRADDGSHWRLLNVGDVPTDDGEVSVEASAGLVRLVEWARSRLEPEELVGAGAIDLTPPMAERLGTLLLEAADRAA